MVSAFSIKSTAFLNYEHVYIRITIYIHIYYYTYGRKHGNFHRVREVVTKLFNYPSAIMLKLVDFLLLSFCFSKRTLPVVSKGRFLSEDIIPVYRLDTVDP